MECYTHENQNAVGLCKSCLKAVCRECAKETENGIACSDECAFILDEIEQVVERNKKIYGIGKYNSRIPSTGVIMWFIISAVMWLAFLGPYLKNSEFNTGSLAVAIGFTFIFFLTIYSAKRTGVKC